MYPNLNEDGACRTASRYAIESTAGLYVFKEFWQVWV
jgi:hypothetical protein